MKYIIRIVALPFFAGLCLIGIVILYFKHLVNFVRFGGESVAYTNKNQRKCINDIYLELVDSRKNAKSTEWKCDSYEFLGAYVDYYPSTDTIIVSGIKDNSSRERIREEFRKVVDSGEINKYQKFYDKI